MIRYLASLIAPSRRHSKKGRKKRRSSRVSPNSPEYDALFGATASRPTGNAPIPVPKQSFRAPSSTSECPIEMNKETAVRSTFASQPFEIEREANFTQSPSKHSKTRVYLAKLPDESLSGLRSTLNRWGDTNLSADQMAIITQIVQRLSEADGSMTDRISSLLLLVEEEHSKRRFDKSPNVKKAGFGT